MDLLKDMIAWTSTGLFVAILGCLVVANLFHRVLHRPLASKYFQVFLKYVGNVDLERQSSRG